MPFQYVTTDDLRTGLQSLRDLKVPESEFVPRLKSMAQELEYQRSKDIGPSVGVKAAITGAVQMPIDIMTGLTTITPAGSGAESLLKSATTSLRENLINPDWQRKVGEASSGPLSSMETWEANLGSMVPMIAEMALLKKAGGSIGGRLAGASGASIGGALAPTAGFGMQSAGGFLEQAKSYGIDEDIAKRFAVPVGVLNAGLGEVGFLAGAGGMKADPAKLGGVKKALSELGVTALGGLAMAGTEEINSHALQQAFAEMKQRNPDWNPPQTPEATDPLRALALGMAPIAVMRGASHLASNMTPSALHERLYAHTEELSAQGKELTPFFETGKIAHPGGEVGIEPMGWTAMREQAKTVPTSEQLKGAVERAPDERVAMIANRLGLTVPEGTDPETIRSMVLSNVGKFKEGPMLTADGAIKSRVLNIAHPIEAEYGKRVDDSARAYFGVAPDPADVARITNERMAGMGLDPANAEVVKITQEAIKQNMIQSKQQEFLSLRHQALLDAGLTPELAAHPTLNPPDLTKSNGTLPSLLTRDQFAKYSDSLKGQLENVMRRDEGNQVTLALKKGQFNASLFTNLTKPEPILDPVTGKEIGGITPEEGSSLMMSMSSLMPHPIQQMMLDAATGLRTLEPFRVLSQRLAQSNDTLAKVGKYRLNAWFENMPKQFNIGSGRSRMHDLVSYLRIRGGNEAEVRNLLKQLNVEGEANPELALARRVIDQSKINSNELLPRLTKQVDSKTFMPEHVVELATKIAGKEKVLSDWFVRNGFIDQDMYRDKYMPWVKKFWSNKNATMDQWIKYRDTVMHQGLRDAGMSEKRISEMKSIHDLVGKFQQHGIQIPETDPFFQYLRKADEDSLAFIARETDQDVLNDMYAKTALKSFYFDDIAPGIGGYMKNIEGALLEAQEKNQRLGLKMNVPYDGTMQMLQDMMDSFLDIPPDRATKAFNKYNLVSNSNMATRMIKRGVEAWNKHMGFKHEIPEMVSISDFLSGVASVTYTKCLGLPFQFLSPIKNIMTQMPAAQIFGEEATVRGMVRAISGKDKAYFEKLGVLSKEFIPVHGKQAITSGVKNIGEMSLSAFKASENYLRSSGASAALECWERLEPTLKKDPTLNSMGIGDFAKVLLRNQKLSNMGIPESELMKTMTLADRYKQEFTRGIGQQLKETTQPRGFRGMTDVMYELIRKGRADEAKDFFVQLGAELPNWRYGKGGGINAFRNPVVKIMTMFTRWPINYVAFHAWLANPKNGLVRREMQIMASTFLLAGLASTLGLSKSTAKWVGLGPVPEQVGFGGPIYDEFSKVWKALVGGVETAQAEIVASPEERDKAMKRFQQSWKSAFEE
jgi:hypothetical protein